MGILSDTIKPEILWEELHSEVKTNVNGVFNLVIGTGTWQAGSVQNFSEIAWKSTPLFLRVQINYLGSWRTMGHAKLWTVPYSMVAADLAGTVGKLDIKGTTTSPEDALFEVKNKDGQTIFGVYNEGVRIYIDDRAKGTKGGFAVGGFDNTKSIEEYLRVTRDSVRIYFDSDPLTKGLKGGFAVGGYDMTKAYPEDYLFVTPTSTQINMKNILQKGTKGGFAVGGFDQVKGSAIPFVDLTPKNYFIGHESGMNIDTGKYNSSIGYQAGKATTGGSYNIFIGYQSGFSNKVGSDNTFVGYQAGFNNIGNNAPGVYQHGKWNCYFGYKAGYSSLYGDNNTLVGFEAGMNNQASMNTFIGHQSGVSNTEGGHNTFIGVAAGIQNTVGSGNVFMGNLTGYGNTAGENNIYIGGGAGAYFKSGNNNVVIGDHAGSGTVYGGDGVGSNNVLIGFEAGKYSHNGTSNIFIGNMAGYNETGSNLLYINNNSESTPLVYGNFTTKAFRINGDVEYTGTLGTVSDIRLKENITALGDVMEYINQISGVYFDWKQSDTIGLMLKPGRQIGVIAQDVEKVYPELVTVNDLGYKTVDYSKLTPVLLEAVKTQQKIIESQNSRIEKLELLMEQLLLNSTE